jgi:hypothetical protein
MKPQALAVLPLIAASFLLPAIGEAQTAAPSTLQVVGHSGTAPVTQVKGKSYVEVDSLSRLIGGTVLLQSNRITMTLPPAPLIAAPPSPAAPVASLPEAAPPKPQPTFSPDFLRAGIEALTEIREWRIAIVNAVQTGNPVSEDWVGPYRRAADTKRALAAAAATAEYDHNTVPLLQSEFNNMQQLSDSFLALNKSRTYTPTDAFDNNPLDQKVLACARGLADLAASNQFQDVTSCH